MLISGTEYSPRMEVTIQPKRTKRKHKLITYIKRIPDHWRNTLHTSLDTQFLRKNPQIIHQIHINSDSINNGPPRWRTISASYPRMPGILNNFWGSNETHVPYSRNMRCERTLVVDFRWIVDVLRVRQVGGPAGCFENIDICDNVV